ncbi:MAG TPA: calcium-translocating P-type ATPase, PMCA-type [Candidatus Hydrogenedentes bacterium]|nr:calcium-translocating P-type ATPase, PMCA-type [Candidatus Hydrogenedentota bacterium]
MPEGASTPDTRLLWHTIPAEDALRALKIDAQQGLDTPEASHRLAQHGPNELTEKGIKSPWRILWEQLTAFLVLILIGAAVLSLAVGETTDAIAILVIVVLNALLGLSQEYRAEKAMAALKRMATPNVRVRRNGHVVEISAKELVPGDIVFLEAGAAVPADGRLIEAANLRIQEAALTGESEPVEKDILPTAADAALGDRKNMAYLGTAVTYGRGLMLITSTGMNTELGRIASMLQSVEREPTPLQVRLDELGRILTYVAVAIIILVGSVQYFRGETLKNIFLSAVSMAVAAVPEGLPAVVTIALALGAQRMLRRRVLIRKLTAVETLGSVTTICSDKTGTLTENRMTVVSLELSEGSISFAGGRFETIQEERNAQILLGGLALVNDAVLKEEFPGRFSALGDPTEGALVTAAAAIGLSKPALDQAFPRLCEAPFDSSRKRMTTIHALPQHRPDNAALASFSDWAIEQGPYIAFTKGSVDGLLQLSARRLTCTGAEPLNDALRAEMLSAHDRIAGEGIRVLGLAFRPIQEEEKGANPELMENGLTFIGMVGMVDPVRKEVPDAVRTCQSAGIVPIMITGDHPLTARYIARQLHLAQDETLLTGQDLDKLTENDWPKVVRETRVYARVAPEHKLHIVETLQEEGQITAMTGDGVNDAPALKKANIGVAMGITGTDVSKEASDMVLQDDNFATIVAAVEEGRVIYDNIRRFIRYIMSTNSGELWVMLAGSLIGMPPPLLPIQILWMNLVTDGLPGLAMAMEPPERDVMRRPPRRPDESIIGRAMGVHIVWVGLLMALVTLGAGYSCWIPGNEASWHQAQTMIFTIVVFLQLGHAMAIRSIRDSLFQQGIFSNLFLLGAVSLMVILQAMVVYVPFCHAIFGTTSLDFSHFLLCILLGSSVFWAVEFEKWLFRRFDPRYTVM